MSYAEVSTAIGHEYAPLGLFTLHHTMLRIPERSLVVH